MGKSPHARVQETVTQRDPRLRQYAADPDFLKNRLKSSKNDYAVFDNEEF